MSKGIVTNATKVHSGMTFYNNWSWPSEEVSRKANLRELFKVRSEGWIRGDKRRKNKWIQKRNQNIPRPHSRREHGNMKNLKDKCGCNVENEGVQDKAREISMCQTIQSFVGYIKEFVFILRMIGSHRTSKHKDDIEFLMQRPCWLHSREQIKGGPRVNVNWLGDVAVV